MCGYRMINVKFYFSLLTVILSFLKLEREPDFANVSDHPTPLNVHGMYIGHPNGHERLGTFESECSNTLERMVENVHGTVTFTLQKRKNHFIYLEISILFKSNSVFYFF